MTAQPFASFRTVPVLPANAEHMQARARDVQATVLQIILDGDFPTAAVRSFPVLEQACERTEAELAAWSAAFDRWWSALPDDVRERIDGALVIS